MFHTPPRCHCCPREIHLRHLCHGSSETLLGKENLTVHRYCGGPPWQSTPQSCASILRVHRSTTAPPGALHTSRIRSISSFNQPKRSFMFFSSPFWCRESRVKVGFHDGWVALAVRVDAVRGCWQSQGCPASSPLRSPLVPTSLCCRGTDHPLPQMSRGDTGLSKSCCNATRHAGVLAGHVPA